MRNLALILIAAITSLAAIAQEKKGTISIQINNETGTGLEGITVDLLKAKDSILVKTSVTDKSGIAVIENIPMGEYRVRTSSVGFSTSYSEAFLLDESNSVKTLTPMAINTKATSLQGVTVSAKKP